MGKFHLKLQCGKIQMAPETSILQKDLLAEISQIYGQEVTASSSVTAADFQLESRRVLVIDDEAINIKLVRKVLQEDGFVFFSDLTDPREAMTHIRAYRPDIILLDIMMPHVSGLEILEAVRATAGFQHIPVIILTASADREIKLEALRLGATDFLAKPVDRAELLPRVRNALQSKCFHDHFADYSKRLEDAVKERTREVVNSRLQIIHCLAQAAELHDDVTGKHVLRVGKYAGVIGRAMGLGRKEAQLLELAAQLHDVGKIGIPDAILKKEGKLTPEEFEVMKRHCLIGKCVFDQPDGRHNHFGSDDEDAELTIGQSTDSPLLQLAARTALTHHEWFDGTGYPLGLSGHDIPLEGRITAVADVFDALTGKRSYKDAIPVERCFEILEEQRGTQFDPEVLDAFVSQRDKVIEIQIAMADGA